MRNVAEVESALLLELIDRATIDRDQAKRIGIRAIRRAAVLEEAGRRR
jgi:hypothetical protein